MITEELIREAYIFLRTKNSSITDEVLDFMKDASLQKLQNTEAIPFKKIYKDGSFNIACECGYVFLKEHFKYCPDCGKKLLWDNIILD